MAAKKTPAQVYAGKAAAANNANIGNVQDWVTKILGKANSGTRSTAPLIVHKSGSGGATGVPYEERQRAATVTPRKAGGFKYQFPNEAEAILSISGGLPRIGGKLAEYDDYAELTNEKGEIGDGGLGGGGEPATPEQEQQRKIGEQYLSGTTSGQQKHMSPEEKAQLLAQAAAEKNPLKAAALRNRANGLQSAGVGVSEITDAATGEGNWLGGNADMGHEEAPQNVGQWLMNALSTGTYIGARAGEAIGETLDERGVGRALEEGRPLDALAGATYAAPEAIGRAAAGSARGAAEGLGFRFDKERPKTWGQNLEDLGTEDALKNAIGEDAGGFTQGVLGTVADIGLDPATYLTLGGSGAFKGAASGAREASKGLTGAERLVAGAKGAVSGAAEGTARRREEIRLGRQSQAQRAAADKEARRMGGDEAYNEANRVLDGEYVPTEYALGGQRALEEPMLEAETFDLGELTAGRAVDEASEPPVGAFDADGRSFEAGSEGVSETTPGTALAVLEREAATRKPVAEPAPAPRGEQITAQDEALYTSGQPFDEKLLSPRARSATGRAVWNAMQDIGAHIKAKTPAGYTSDIYRTAHKSIMKSLSQTARRSSGVERAGLTRSRYLDAMDAVEAHNRASGIIPRIPGTKLVDDLHVGAADIVRSLPGDVADRAFFSPNRARGSRQAEGRAGFTGGFTLYPDVVGSAVQIARAGGSYEDVAKWLTAKHHQLWMATKKNNPRGAGPDFVATPEGKAAVEAVARAIVEPEYLAKVGKIDSHYAKLAATLDAASVKGGMDNAFQAIAKVISEEADRGTLMATLEKVMRDMDELTGESPALTTQGIGTLNQAIINGILGEKGYRVWKNVKEFTKATGRKESPEAAAKVQDAQLAKLRGEPAPEQPKVKPQAEQRREAATAGAQQMQEEFDDIVTDMVDDLRERLSDEEFAQVLDEGWEYVTAEAMARLSNGYASEFGSKLDRTLAGLSGRRGLTPEALAIRVDAENASFVPMANFSEKRMLTFQSIRENLARRSGRRPTIEQTNEYIKDRLWTALASTSTKIWDDAAAMREALVRGQEFPEATPGGARQFDALDADEVDMALALRAMIDHVMNPHAGGKLTRHGLTVEDINEKLRPRLGEDMKDFALDGDDINAQAVAWRTWQNASDPLEVLDRMNQAIHLAEVPAQIAREFAGIFGSKHSPATRGWTRDDFVKNGWLKVDPDHVPVDSVMRFMDDSQWYAPEELNQLRYLDMYLRAAKAPNPSKTLGQLVLAMDAPLHAMKSLATIWRPAHHINNVMGEMAFNAIDGVNPLNYIRSYRALSAAQGLLDDSTNALTDALGQLGIGRGLKVDPKYTGDTMRVHIKDANGSRFEEVPIVEAMKRWKTTGVAMTSAASRDLIEGTVATSGKRAQRLGRFVDQVERPLGAFSAVRDNLTRVGHAIDMMERQTYGSLDEAFTKTAAKVHEYHPTIRTLGAEEQRTARRLFMFYTWMRQAVSVVLRTALDRPGLVTWPAKLQYNMAEAAGLNPESIGGPTSDDPRVSQYAGNSLYGPTLKGRPVAIEMLMKAMGWTPDDEAPGLAGQDLPEDLWEYSLSTPQLDTLQTLFGGATFNPERGPQGYLGGLVGVSQDTIGESLNPLIVAGANTVGLGQQVATGGSVEEQSVENLLQSGGALSAVAKMLPGSNPGDASFFESATRGLAGTPPKLTPLEGEEAEQAAEDRAKQTWNFLSGNKLQNRTRANDAKGAKLDWRKRVERELQNLGVTDEDVIDDIVERAWEQQQSRIRG